MKQRKWFAELLVVILALATLSHSSADELFQLYWRGNAYTTGANGQISVRPFSEQMFINQVARDNRLDPRHLVFVYRADKRDTAVVRAADGKFVADVIQMEFSYTDVTNSTQSRTVRQTFLFDEYHTQAIGSACGGETAVRRPNGTFSTFSFRGAFQYALPEDRTVYVGTFSTGKRIVDRTGE